MSKIRGSSFPGPRPGPTKPSIAKGDIRKNPNLPAHKPGAAPPVKSTYHRTHTADGHGKTLATFKKSLHAELGR
jgi:hypothetical protein